MSYPSLSRNGYLNYQVAKHRLDQLRKRLAKVLFQELCRQKLDWDEEIPESMADHWNRWLADLPQLSALTVPRCLNQQHLKIPQQYSSITSQTPQRPPTGLPPISE